MSITEQEYNTVVNGLQTQIKLLQQKQNDLIEMIQIKNKQMVDIEKDLQSVNQSFAEKIAKLETLSKKMKKGFKTTIKFK